MSKGIVSRPAEVANLVAFLGSWRRIVETAPLSEDLEKSLRGFLAKLKVLSGGQDPVPEPKPDTSNLSGLKSFCQRLGAMRWELDRKGKFVNVWAVAGLKRDEARHAAVLAWFLDTNANHGFRNAIFKSWVATLAFAPKLQTMCQRADEYVISREVYPMLDGTNRVDIEISSESFYICIEVKIDAAEGPDQLKRYVEVCAQRAGTRPWAVIYLARAIPLATSSDPGAVVLTTWALFSRAVQMALEADKQLQDKLPTELLVQFLNHVKKL